MFTTSIDMTALPTGDYCFIINPRDDSDEEDLRATRWFTLEESASENPEEKNQCKKGGWEDSSFKNQGQCVRFVETGKDSR